MFKINLKVSLLSGVFVIYITDEFKRAVLVCTGQRLNDHLVHTVFQLFDIDGDGHLSHKEFISVMKDRLHRGFKVHTYTYYQWFLFIK